MRRALGRLVIVAGACASDALAQAPDGVVFRNHRSVGVVVELRVEGSAGCLNAITIASPTIPPGARWQLSTEKAVCWRRQQTPGRADGKWTSWQRLAPTSAASTTEVAL
jgi:hypothetical protein